jgi:two-component system response regulator FixJ
LVFIVDDDAHLRRAVWYLLESTGYVPRVFASGEDLLAELEYLPPAPMLIDLHMPGLDGLHLLGEVKQRIPIIPVVMMSGHGDIECAVKAMKLGAQDFVEKPFADERLLAAVATATAALTQAMEHEEDLLYATRRIAELSAREAEVLAGLAAGQSNKVIAFTLGLSIRTVEMHRVRMMRRLAVRTLSEALRLAHLAGLEAGNARPGKQGSER